MIIGNDFFNRDCLEAARELVGKLAVRRLDNGEEIRVRITETEAYCGEEDKACHASRGKTPRNSVLYEKAGTIYVYLCYGMHNLVNIVTDREGFPSAILIRAGEGCAGPGLFSKKLMLDRSFNGKELDGNVDFFIEDDGFRPEIRTDKRVGINYAGEEWINKPWRFIAAE